MPVHVSVPGHWNCNWWNNQGAICNVQVVNSKLIIASVAIAILTSQHRCIYWHIFWQLELSNNCNCNWCKPRCLGCSSLSTSKYQFSYDYQSQAMLSSVSTWMGNRSSVAWVLLLTLKFCHPILVVGSVWCSQQLCSGNLWSEQPLEPTEEDVITAMICKLEGPYYSQRFWGASDLS